MSYAQGELKLIEREEPDLYCVANFSCEWLTHIPVKVINGKLYRGCMKGKHRGECRHQRIWKPEGSIAVWDE